MCVHACVGSDLKTKKSATTHLNFYKIQNNFLPMLNGFPTCCYTLRYHLDFKSLSLVVSQL